MGDEPRFGAPPIVIRELEQIDPLALEALFQTLEQRGLRVPLSQIVGFPQMTPRTHATGGSGASLGTTTSTSFVDVPSTPAPADLRPGKYLIFFSARLKISSSANVVVFGVQENGSDPGGATSVGAPHIITNETEPSHVSQMYASTLRNDLNTLKFRWLVDGGTATVYEHTLTYVKLANAV